MSESARERALQVFREAPGALRARELDSKGVSQRVLRSLMEEGLLEHVSRGIYRLADSGVAGEYEDLTTVSLRVPKAVVCLVSALVVHGATTEIMHEVQIALPRRTKAPIIDFPPVHVFCFSGPAWSEGLSTFEASGTMIRVYNLAKTIVDCFRFRNKIGIDVATSALKQAVGEGRASRSDIINYAKQCRIRTVIMPYLEMLS